MKNCIRRAVIASALSAAALTNSSSAAAQTGFGQSFLAPSAPSTLLTSLSLTGLSGSATANPFLAQIFAFSGTALLGPSLFSQTLASTFSGGFSLTPTSI